MRSALLTIQSVFLWTVSIVHFIPGALFVTTVGQFVSPQTLDPLLRLLCRNVMRLAGARVEARFSSESRPEGACFYAVNHVEIFDPFIIVSSTDRPTRGLELESHFRVPVYGWLMKGLGSVPVPVLKNRAGIERMRRDTRAALDKGVSLVVYPEGTRTRSGALGPFRPGLFRMAVDLGVTIVPVTVVGAYEHKRVGSSRITPGRIVIHFHDAIVPGDDPIALSHKVWRVVNTPLEGRTDATPAVPDP